MKQENSDCEVNRDLSTFGGALSGVQHGWTTIKVGQREEHQQKSSRRAVSIAVDGRRWTVDGGWYGVAASGHLTIHLAYGMSLYVQHFTLQTRHQTLLALGCSQRLAPTSALPPVPERRPGLLDTKPGTHFEDAIDDL